MRLAEHVVAADEQVVDDLAVGVLRRLHGRVAPERGDLDDLAAAEEDVREAEAPPDDAAVAEQGPHVLRPGARRDVEVLRLAAEQQVAHAAADEVRLVARRARGAGRPWRRPGRCARRRGATSWRTRPVPACRLDRAASLASRAGVRGAGLVSVASSTVKEGRSGGAGRSSFGGVIRLALGRATSRRATVPQSVTRAAVVRSRPTAPASPPTPRAGRRRLVTCAGDRLS